MASERSDTPSDGANEADLSTWSDETVGNSEDGSPSGERTDTDPTNTERPVAPQGALDGPAADLVEESRRRPTGGERTSPSEETDTEAADWYEDPPIGPDLSSVDPSSVDRDWLAYFPFEPYRQQIDGIDTALETMADGGYLALEGACGTGKTLIKSEENTRAFRRGMNPTTHSTDQRR